MLSKNDIIYGPGIDDGSLFLSNGSVLSLDPIRKKNTVFKYNGDSN